MTIVTCSYITPRLTVKIARRYWAIDYIDTITLINRIYDCYASICNPSIIPSDTKSGVKIYNFDILS